MDLGLQGRVVIVTGGASNIGRAISFAFAREGKCEFLRLALEDVERGLDGRADFLARDARPLADAGGEDDLLLAGRCAESSFDGELGFAVGSDTAVDGEVFDFGGLREGAERCEDECEDVFHRCELVEM